MDVQRILTGLVQAAQQGSSEYHVRPYFMSRRKFAAFAYVAGQLGYRYTGHTPGTGATNNPYFTFQRAPDAQERFAVALTNHPGTLRGRDFPGMQPGHSLKPLPAVQHDVDVLYSQMVLDGCERYNRRVLPNIVLLLVVAVLVLGFSGFPLTGVLVAGGTWLGFFVLYLSGLVVVRCRSAKHHKHLERANTTRPLRNRR